MFTINDLEKLLAEYDENILKPIRADRGERYGTPRDTLYNVRHADPCLGWRGAFVNARECFCRISKYFLLRKTELSEKQVADFRNAVNDLNNYAKYIKVLFEQEPTE